MTGAGSQREGGAGSERFSVLMVCTGNICRSPLAEHLLRDALGDEEVDVMSAGTAACDGLPITRRTLQLAESLGVRTVLNHRAHRLTVHDLKSADLVRGLAREHRRAAVQLLPAASRRTFTLREFERLLGAVDGAGQAGGPGLSPAGRMRARVEAVSRLRGTLPPLTDPSEADVVDPYRRDAGAYRRSAQQIAPAVERTARLLHSALGEW